MAASFLLAYANGANDNLKAVATVYGSGTLSYRSSLILATVSQLAGSAASVLLAGGLLHAFSGAGLVPKEALARAGFLPSVATGALATVLLATRMGIPLSTTHALVGGLLGAGWALAPGQLAWGRLGSAFVLPLLVSPLMAAAAAAVLYPWARSVRRRLGVEEASCVCLEAAPPPLVQAPQGGLALSRTVMHVEVDRGGACGHGYVGTVAGISAQALLDTMHVVSAAALGFARGLNDTPKVLGLLVAAAWAGLPGHLSLLCVATAMALGGALSARRVAHTLGHRITGMNHGQGFVANVVASALVLSASLTGLPVSTTHVSAGAIFGIGAWTGSARPRVIAGILLAWVGTLPLAAVLAGLLARGLFA